MMNEKVRLCAKCGEAISPERIACRPESRFCVTCAAEIERDYGGEFRLSVNELKLGKKGGLKTTSVDYTVDRALNPNVPLQFRDCNEA